MFTTSIVDDHRPQTTDSPPFVHTPESLRYTVNHVFFPVKPDFSGNNPKNYYSLARAVCAAAHAYGTHVSGTTEQDQWGRITKMLDNFQASMRTAHLNYDHVISQLRGTEPGDILAYFIQPEDAAIILTKREKCTLCEAFQVAPHNYEMRESPWPLIRSYPGSAVEVPNEVFDDVGFQAEFARFLSDVIPRATLPSPTAPHYINALLNSALRRASDTTCVSHLRQHLALVSAVLHDIGCNAGVSRVTKHIRDRDVRDRNDHHRSPLWLFVRVAIQMAVDPSLGRSFYKSFILFFICTLAKDEDNTSLSRHLHLMSSTILRRLNKLDSSAPDWLSELALATYSSLQETLNAGWKQLSTRQSPFQNLSQEELVRDTRLSLSDSHEYIRKALENHGNESVPTPFSPNHRRRGTLGDFMSLDGTFFDEAYNADPDIALYDVERSVEEGIDDWLASVTNVDDACAQLALLLDRYTGKDPESSDPERASIRLLTAVELCVAIDKLVVREVSMVADYFPLIPLDALKYLLLRTTTKLHRLSCVLHYLSARHSQSRYSVLSNTFTEASLEARYYDQSPILQQLKARIEEDAKKIAAASRTVQHGGSGDCLWYPSCSRLTKDTESPQSPLPASPLHAKLVVFELQCPACIHIWRSAAACIWEVFGYHGGHSRHSALFNPDPIPSQRYRLLSDISALQPHFIKHQGHTSAIQIRLAYVHAESSRSRDRLALCYVRQDPAGIYQMYERRRGDEMPEKRAYFSLGKSFYFPEKLAYELEDHCPSCERLQIYMNSTFRQPNSVLAYQGDCPADFSLDEFVTFAHLRSGGSLQWLNILRGLRTRTLNLRHHQVHFLLSRTVSHVGPFDSSTGTWIWHQELQDPSFCTALLNELESLFMDIGTSSMDSVLMNTISLLLTRVLTSSPNENISRRTITLLQSVRRRTFGWVQDLSYGLALAPTNKERANLLLEMAATCRSTFEVDPFTLCKIVHSPEDVDTLLSCSFFIRALKPAYTRSDECSQLLIDRDRSLAPALEGILRDIILADPSDYGVDIAVGRIFTSYRPGAPRWKQLRRPHNRWLTCETMDQPSQTVHVNLLDGELRVAGQPSGSLPDEIRDLPEFRQFLHAQGFLTLPSSFPGMDLTFWTTSRCKVHFSLRGCISVLRMQDNQISDTLVLIPSSLLRGDLPPTLIDGHLHWLNLSTKVVEIRPLHRPWDESPENWRIDCTSGQYRMTKGNETLLDVRSPTWAMVGKCFECLNCRRRSSIVPQDLIVTTTSPTDSTTVIQLSVTLPRYSLSFFINERGELESCNFKDMVYDEDQCVGALIGLHNLLVLRSTTHIAGTLVPKALIPRRILIPIGELTMPTDHQVQINIPDPDSQPLNNSPLYYSYFVDTERGCLVGNGSLTSTEYLARLHIMTSWHRPDPLTGKTGVQASLVFLRSAACRSIMRLKAFRASDSWTQFPQIYAAYKEIRRQYYWDLGWFGKQLKVEPREKNTAQRAAHLFPLDASRPSSESLEDVPSESGLPVLQSSASSLRYLFKAGSPTQITLGQLMHDRSAPQLLSRVTLRRDSYSTSFDGIPTLDRLFSHFQTDLLLQREYLAHVHDSAQLVHTELHTVHRVPTTNLIEALKEHYEQCLAAYWNSLDILKKSLAPTANPYEAAHDQYGRWPLITGDALLPHLASTSPTKIPSCWKKCLESLALLLLDLQRSRRLLRFALDGLEEDFLSELGNEGCDGWDPEKYPDWLLIQIQGNFLIRGTQAEAALTIMFPQSGQNTVTQVNSGEGKSSVIIPIAAAALADGEQLVRVVVPRTLTLGMFELLVARLGGLANRPIYHLPFSRTSEYDQEGNVISPQIDGLRKLMQQCMAERGILLVQPEHVVSLKLMSIQEQLRKWKLSEDPLPQLLRKHAMATLSPGSDSAHKWLSFQKWVHSHVRDILDESDEILHPRFQLIYTLGPQRRMDGYPARWTITQKVLELVKKHLYSRSRHTPDSIHYECSQPGSFPHVRILRPSDVSQDLVALITQDVMAGRLPGLNFQHTHPALNDAVRNFISNKDVFRIPDTVKTVEEYAKKHGPSHLWNGLLLLRGLLTSDILLFALSERRWRVDYGLVTKLRSGGNQFINPTMLAVPYRAKDVPAVNAQFGHPDLTIIFTCLSYYYAGLSEEQLRTSFEVLLDEDDPSTEYAHWIRQYDCEPLPDSLRKPTELTLFPSEQWDKVIFPLFSRNQAVVDFYLSRVVFPKEAKEFPWKISGSSWDLAEKRTKLITGFSGTNDGRWLLPLTIAQRDLDHQKGTNAKALAHLLRPENAFYVVAHGDGEKLTTLEFLRLVTTQRPEIRILLDVGAQILDVSNKQVGMAWLELVRDSDAAVYFDENDELMVSTRHGVTQPMSSSPLSHQLDRCVVYLDQAHTRGTDIKLPIGSRAAVTLGPNVTKDALVQGCMRMRKLGHGHSIMFFAPRGVDRTIRAAAKIDPDTPVTTVDILCWAIHETWADIRQRAPYWAHRGMNHRLRHNAWSGFVNGNLTGSKLADAWLQPELRSLADLYAPCETKNPGSSLSTLDPDIRQRCDNLGVLSLPSAQMDEEQEREVNREREREREVDLPPEARPATHRLHPAVSMFAKTGSILPLHSAAFRPVFTTLEKSLRSPRGANIWNSSVLATADFCRTIKPDSTRGTLDQYLRPVQWILSRQNDHGQVLVLLSPFEVEQLLPHIRASKAVRLHLYAPRTSKRMKATEDLNLYTVPSLPTDWTPPSALMDQLNVFAGQLYLKDYDSYVRLCRLLDVPTNETPNNQVARRIPGSLKELKIALSGSPLHFVRALIAARTRGRPFAHTHMGRILEGQVLTEKDFETGGSSPPANRFLQVETQ